MTSQKSGSAQKQITLSSIPDLARTLARLNLPIHVHFYGGRGNDDHLNFRCQLFRPYGADPQYRGGKYHNESQTCIHTMKIIDGVIYRTAFHCRKENNGSEYWPAIKLPDEHTPKHERQAIAYGMKLLSKVPA